MHGPAHGPLAAVRPRVRSQKLQPAVELDFAVGKAPLAPSDAPTPFCEKRGLRPCSAMLSSPTLPCQTAAHGIAAGMTFYHVAIDCPGYGRTPGDCQTIRSDHAAFLGASQV